MSEASPWESTMRIGILGSGLMGGKLGTIFARAGHEVVFSYARSEKKLRKLAQATKGKARDRKSTRLNSSHSQISYAVFCLKKKKTRATHVSTYSTTRRE